MLQYYRSFLNFTNNSNYGLHRKRKSHSGIVSSWNVFLVPQSLSLTTLIFLKNTGQSLCGMSFSLSLPDVSSWLDSGYEFFGKTYRSDIVLLSTHVKRHKIRICSLTGHVNFEHLIKEVSARFLHCKISYFSLIIYKDIVQRKVTFL